MFFKKKALIEVVIGKSNKRSYCTRYLRWKQFLGNEEDDTLFKMLDIGGKNVGMWDFKMLDIGGKNVGMGYFTGKKDSKGSMWSVSPIFVVVYIFSVIGECALKIFN